MSLRATLIAVGFCGVILQPAAQNVSDADFIAAKAAFSRSDYQQVIDNVNKLVNKAGGASIQEIDEARFMRATALCRTLPITAANRREGNQQLSALQAELKAKIRQESGALATTDGATKRLWDKAGAEEKKCLPPFDLRMTAKPGQTVAAQIGGKPHVQGILIETDLENLKSRQLRTEQRLLQMERSRGLSK